MDIELVREVTSMLVLGLVGVLLLTVKGLVPVFLKWLEGKVGEQKVSDFKRYALMCVETLKQSPAYEYLDPERKKELAAMWLTDYAKKMNYPYDYEYIDRTIEEAVAMVKRFEPLEDLFDTDSILDGLED
jgi:hypothetical protein